MKHIHKESLDSTQEYLQEYLTQDDENILVSCNKQNNGKGQYNRRWESVDTGIFMSCLISANPTLTLTSLEVGVLVKQFLFKKFNKELKLKWPNDILDTNGNKCGGILINNLGNNSKLIVGIGINLYGEKIDLSSSRPLGYICETQPIETPKELTLEIYKYILDNRLTPDLTISMWTEAAIHINQRVQIRDSETIQDGVFIGVGKMGEALIKDLNGSTKKFYSGSLLFSI